MTTTTPRTRLDHATRRRQILAGAREQFGDRHYGAVSMEDVAKTAGVTRGLLNYYFGTKRELYVEVVREMLRVPSLPVPEFVQGVSVEERLAESLAAWLEIISRNRGIWLAMISAEGLGAEAEIQGILDDSREQTVDRMIEVLGAGPAPAAPPELRAILRSFGGLAEATSREWLEKKRITRVQAQALLSDVLLYMVRDVLPALLGEGGH